MVLIGLLHCLVLLLRAGDRIGVAQVGNPGGAGVFKHGVHIADLQRLARRGRAGDIGQVLYVGTGGFQEDGANLAQDDLLGEVFGTDGNIGAVQVDIG